MLDSLSQINLNLSNIVVDYIMEKILTGEYKQGEKISERKIAEDLKISRSPIREGIKVIQEQGILEFIPRKGNFVTIMSIEDIKEVFEIRCFLEDDIIEILIKDNILNDNDFNKLSSIVDEMVYIANSDKPLNIKIYEISIKDIEFHKYMWEKSNSKRRLKILKDMYLNLQLAMAIENNVGSDLEAISIEHNLIIDAIKDRNLDLAKKHMRNHIVSFRGEILADV